MKPIVTLTLNPSIDASSETEKVEPMRKNRISNERFDPGGGGINVARVLKELGGNVHAIYLSGGLTGQTLDKMIDEIGLFTDNEFLSEGIRVSAIRSSSESTRREYRFVPEGPEISEAEWRACLDMIASLDADYLVASGSLPHTAYRQISMRASLVWLRSKSMCFVLDTSGDALGAALAEGIYLLKPNQRELAQVAGADLPTRAAQHAAAMDIIAKGHTKVVAVSLGGDGAFVADDKECFDLAAPPADMHSAVGAGDSFVAGMTLGLVNGRDLRGALRLAVAAGTAAIMTMGTELCRRADVERLDSCMIPDR